MRYVQDISMGQYEEKKSKFIGELYPIKSVEDAEERISQVRKKYYDARHHCYAYVLGQNNEVQKQSDDGEPSQTAGMPILNVLKGNDLRDALIVVTRYFGGTLLGTGGLVRSYTEASKAAVNNAVLMESVLGYRAVCEIDYTQMGKIRYITESLSIKEENVSYTDKVKMSWLVPRDTLGAFEKELQEIGHGKLKLEIEETQWYSV